jgi:hypothetical protein
VALAGAALTAPLPCRIGIARLAEQTIRKTKGIPEGKKLDTIDRITASTIGGALGCWNQPIEVVRVEVSQPQHSASPTPPGKC